MNRLVSKLQKGKVVTLEDVLNNREARVLKQNRWLKEYPNRILIALKLNVPGPVKQNEILHQIFDLARVEFNKNLQKNKVLEYQFYSCHERIGSEGFWIIDYYNPQVVKQFAIEVEEESPLGRLFDFDVLYNENKKIKVISRSVLGVDMRRCFVCDNAAKACGRNRTHTLLEMYVAIARMIEQDGRISDD